jgi:phosphotransferase system HPr (HPr) family protein
MNGNGQTVQHTLRVSNAEGLHMRPATAFAELAKRFQSDVSVLKDGKLHNGKSPLDLMMLAAAQGTELTVRVEGPDAPDALQKLVDLLIDLSVIEKDSQKESH